MWRQIYVYALWITPLKSDSSYTYQICDQEWTPTSPPPNIDIVFLPQIYKYVYLIYIRMVPYHICRTIAFSSFSCSIGMLPNDDAFIHAQIGIAFQIYGKCIGTYLPTAANRYEILCLLHSQYINNIIWLWEL